MNANPNNVIIIGGGLSGVLLAIYMANLKNGPNVILLEKDPEKLGRGIAYQQEFIGQPLNVISDSMSIFGDKPNHFVDWIKLNSFRYKHLFDDKAHNSFVPRKIFGDYLVENLRIACDLHREKFQIYIDEAISISNKDKLYTVHLSSGLNLNTRNTVLALGNFPPGDLPCVTDEIRSSSFYFSNPWSDKIYEGLTGNERILLIGSGLTAVDVVLGLHLRGFKGVITMISRKGKLPIEHFSSEKKFVWRDPYLVSPLELLRSIRKIIRDSPDVHWTEIIDSLRMFVPNIWNFWKEEEKIIFLRRLRPFWEIARHRIPANSLEILKKLELSNKLILLKGRVLTMDNVKEGLKVSLNNSNYINNFTFNKIINCTGPESNYRKIKFPIINSLISNKLVVPDSLDLGILCDQTGRIINENKEIVEGMWCIGPMRKAVLWETTALREIRYQAMELTQIINGLFQLNG